jgi:hypothetical protein
MKHMIRIHQLAIIGQGDPVRIGDRMKDDVDLLKHLPVGAVGHQELT